jgi:hypothetical protein
VATKKRRRGVTPRRDDEDADADDDDDDDDDGKGDGSVV